MAMSSRILTLSLVGLLLSGGAFADEPASRAVAAAACTPVDGLADLLEPGRVLLLGEIHGTVESPAFALNVACHAAVRGLDVIVGLELSPGAQAQVDTFLDSSGAPADRSELVAAAVWQSSYQDGRTSHAMVDLVEGLRRLRRQGLRVRAALFDASGRRGGQQRDADMAANLAAVVKGSPESMLVVLTGNVHSRIALGTPRNRDYEPMGYLLGRSVAVGRITSLNASYADGTAWICAPDCGVAQLRGRGSVAAGRVEIGGESRPSGHHGWYGAGAMTASTPARRPLDDAAESAAPLPPEPDARREAPPDGPLSPPESSPAETSKFEGSWQAHDFSSRSRTWKIRFNAGAFRAEGGPDDWYVGTIALRPEEPLPELDFIIDDCQCSYKGMTSRAIYYWDGESIVISAPRPGSARPAEFVERSGQMMRLMRLDDN